MADVDLCYVDARELAARLRARKISALEVTRNALERIAETDPSINAFTHVDEEGALAAARNCDALLTREGNPPPLCGIPISVKELIEVRGLPCRYGSRTMIDHVPTEDAPSVARVRAAGAVILGMTSTSEFGFRGYTESLTHGVTRNPWDLSRTPGGSSGGAASSVVAGVTPFALGTDGGGSIRNPASFTGLVGIKAQFGRVPVYPASATPGLAHVGPLARSVADAAMLLRVIAGPDPRDWTSLQSPIGELPDRSWAGSLKIAASFTLGTGQVDDEVKHLVGSALRRLDGLVGRIEPVEAVCQDQSELLLTEFIGGCSARLGSAVEERPEDIDPLLLKTICELRAKSVDHYTRVLRRRACFRDEMRRFFERWDVLLCPMTPSPAWPLGQRGPSGYERFRMWSFFGFPFNLTGQPAATLPCGFTAAGLPVGLQIVVRPQCEPLLIDLLQVFDEVLQATGKRPALTSER